MAAHACDPGTLEVLARGLCEFEVNLGSTERQYLRKP